MSTPPNKFTYPISAIRVIDGDTIEADVDLGFRIRQRQVIRLAGIDAPELRSKDAVEREKAKAAKAGLERFLVVHEPPNILMESTSLDKYGRSLAFIWVNYGDGWGDINGWMIQLGHASPMK